MVKNILMFTNIQTMITIMKIHLNHENNKSYFYGCDSSMYTYCSKVPCSEVTELV